MLFSKGFGLTILEPLTLLNSIIVLYILKFYYSYFTRSIPYPGPLPLPIIGNLHQYFYHKNDISSWLHQLSLKYGDVFELYFGTNKYLMISDSRLVERVMTPTKDSNYFIRVTTRKGLDELQKEDIGMLFNTDFNSWSYIRKIFIRVVGSPSALRLAVKLVGNVFQDLEKLWDNLIEEQGQFWNDEQEKSVEIDFLSWSKRIFAETTMLQTASQKPNVLTSYYNKITNRDLDNLQRNPNEEFLDRLFTAADCVQYYITVPSWIRNLPIINTYTNYLYENLIWTRNYAYDLVKERRKEIESIDDKEELTPDVLNILLTVNTPKDITQSISNENNKKPMTDKEVGGNLIEIFSEGIDAPSNALTFILYFVGNNPDVEQRILDEIERVFNRGSDFKISHEDLSKLVYIEAVIKEVIRIRPATAMISRFSVHSDQIDDYKIPPSTQLAINIEGLHNHRNYWREPTKFNPSRFLSSSNNENEIYNKNALLNFGGGLRMCPGRHSAMTQLKMMVVLLYNKYNFKVITKDPSTQHNVNIQCKELKIRIKHRK